MLRWKQVPGSILLNRTDAPTQFCCEKESKERRAVVSDERQIWNQQDGEPDLWYGRFNRYRLMGTKRSVNAVYRKEHRKAPKSTDNTGSDWYDTAKGWNWEVRARAYDDHVRAEEDRIIAEEKEKVLRSGFALIHKRVKELDRLTRKLIRMTSDESKVWIPETRTFRSGEESTSTVEKVEFNAPLFTLIDKYLGSIAAEMGERVKKKDITVNQIPPDEYGGLNPNDIGSLP